jgi:hypothetical protein
MSSISRAVLRWVGRSCAFFLFLFGVLASGRWWAHCGRSGQVLDSSRHPLGLLPPPLPGVVRRQLSVALANVEPNAVMVRGGE